MLKYILLSVMVSYLMLEQKSMGQTVELKVLSYNIFHGENPYKEGGPTVQNIAELINKHQPDVVFLQEVDSMTLRSQFVYGVKIDFMDSLAKLTNMHGHFAKAIDFAEGGYGEGILTKQKAKFKLVNLPKTEGGEGRSLVLANVTFNDSITMNFAGTHLCHEFEKNRTEQVNAILNLFENDPNPSIVGGDFNFTEDEMGYAIMSSSYQDVASEVGNKSPTYSTEKLEIRIDYIWLDKKSDWKIDAYDVLDASYSDHLPVLVTLHYTK